MKKLLKRFVIPLFLMSTLIFSQVACYDKKTAVEMTKAGILTSDLLAEYYTTLANNQRTVYELKEFNRAMDRFQVLGTLPVPQLSENQLTTIHYYNNVPNCELVRAIIVGKESEEIENQTKTLDSSIKAEEIKKLTPPSSTNMTEVEKGKAATRCMISALEQRAELAKKFSKYFNSFKELADYNYSGQVKDATNDLAKSFSSLVPLPHLSAVTASGIIGEIAGDIANEKQKNNTAKQAKTALEIFTAVKNMFDREKPVYNDINGLLVLESSKAGKHLIEGDMVQVWRLIDIVPDTLGLKVINDKWSGPIPPKKQISEQDSEEVKNEKKLFNARRDALLESFAKLIEARQNRITGSLNDAGGSIGSAMAKMQNTLTEYINNSKTPPSTSEIIAELSRAKFYLEEINKLKKEIISTKKQPTEEINATNQ